MPANTIALPDSDDLLALTINRHVDRERTRMMPMTTMFRVIWEYLAGARQFNVVDLRTGVVTTQHLDKEGKMEFQGPDLLRAIDQVVGYLNGYDFTNKVTGSGQSLSSIRDSAVGQVVSDAAFSSHDLDTAQNQFLHLFVSLGSCGISSHVENNPASGIGMTADLEVIHPSELYPFPSLGMDLSKQRGIGREYFVTLADLENRYSKAKIRDQLKNLYYFTLQTGENPDMKGQSNNWWTSEAINNNQEMKKGHGEYDTVRGELQGYCRIREVWLDGPRRTCSKKVCVSGTSVLQRDDFTGVEAYTPIGFARFIENGTFYGAGMYSLLFSFARQLELLNKNLFTEAMDKERFGYLVIPQGSFQINSTLREVGKGLKVLPWEPDPMTDNGQRPFMVQPYNTGDTPVKTAVYAKNYFESISPLRDIIKEKGRIDSARAMDILVEQADQAMTSPTRGIMRAWGDMYRAGIAKCSEVLMESPRALPVGKLTLDLAGAVIDWEKNLVRFPDNPLPSMSRLSFGPRMAGNKSKAQRKAEATELLKLGLGSPLKILIKSIEEGWDFALWLKPEETAIKSIIRNILTLYNDGVTPGQLLDNPNFARPDIQQMFLDEFMASYKMAVADIAVQREFIAYRKFLISQNGRTLPEGLPYNPDDMAAVMAGQQNAAMALPQQSMASM